MARRSPTETTRKVECPLFSAGNSGQGRIGNNPAPNANDLTIEFERQIEVLGVNGISPSDPNAPYTLEGDGSTTIKISDMSQVGPNGSVKVRVKNDGTEATKVKAAATFWTFNGQRITPQAMLLAAADTVEGLGGGGGAETAAALSLGLAEIGRKLDLILSRLEKV